ncbi:MAG TPA: dockerin type I domain-containing protein, partial [Candidatus Nanoarchaeia archaeon]|nr:dockerin type I domain-containing protein [Candidatus Nanoarchaeia archaeon]
SLDLAIFRSIVIGVQPYINDPVNYPRAACDTRGDMNGDGYLSGLDLFLCSQVANNPGAYGNNMCCDMNNDGTVSSGDIDLLSGKISGSGGIGITIDNKNNVIVNNCTLVDYDIGINMISSGGNTITKSVFNTTSYGIKIS